MNEAGLGTGSATFRQAPSGGSNLRVDDAVFTVSLSGEAGTTGDTQPLWDVPGRRWADRG